MRSPIGSALIAGAILAGTAGLGAPPAFAATWTVSNGGAIAAFSVGSTDFRDWSTNNTYSCAIAHLGGNAPNGTNLSGFAIASLGSGTLNGCTGNFGANGTATLTAATFNAGSYSSGTTIGSLTGIAATLSFQTVLGPCNATVTGSAFLAEYLNSPGVLRIIADAAPGNLTITSATGRGCTGVIASGNRATLAGTYDVSPIIRITSP